MKNKILIFSLLFLFYPIFMTGMLSRCSNFSHITFTNPEPIVAQLMLDNLKNQTKYLLQPRNKTEFENFKKKLCNFYHNLNVFFKAREEKLQKIITYCLTAISSEFAELDFLYITLGNTPFTCAIKLTRQTGLAVISPGKREIEIHTINNPTIIAQLEKQEIVGKTAYVLY